MNKTDEELRAKIKQSLYMHGKLSIIFYKMMDEYIVHKWGEFEKLSLIHETLFNKWRQAGMVVESDSLTLMELPNDEELIFKILTCGSLESELKAIGYM